MYTDEVVFVGERACVCVYVYRKKNEAFLMRMLLGGRVFVYVRGVSVYI